MYPVKKRPRVTVMGEVFLTATRESTFPIAKNIVPKMMIKSPFLTLVNASLPIETKYIEIIMTRNNTQNFLDNFSCKKRKASTAVRAVVMTWDKVAKVPVDWVSPKKRNRINNPEDKTPIRKINL